jgi:hypothetical protein
MVVHAGRAPNSILPLLLAAWSTQVLELLQHGKGHKADAPDDQQLLTAQVLDRFGPLFLDCKGSPSACILCGPARLVALALRGILLGLFVGEQRATGCCGLLHVRFQLLAGHPHLDHLHATCRDSCHAQQPPLPRPPSLAAGLAAHSQPGTALVLLVLLLLLQASYLLWLLVFRPYSSLLLNLTEAVCCGLDLACIAVTTAAYGYTTGGSSTWDGRLQVGLPGMSRATQCVLAPRCEPMHMP